MPDINDRLDSWKAIAEYLDRDPTTVMRWAKERDLPVYSVPGGVHRRRAVYAYKSEIDAWLHRSATHAGLTDQSSRNNQATHADGASTGESGARGQDQSSGVALAVPSMAAEETPVPVADGAFGAAEGSEKSLGDQAGRSKAGPLAPLGVENPPKDPPRSWLGIRRIRWGVLLCGAILIGLAGAAWLRAPSPQPRLVSMDQLTNDGFEKGPGLATDGARIYFTENGRDGWVLAQVPNSGGYPVAIGKVERDSVVQDISPNRSELLVAYDARLSPGAVWIVPLSAGSPRRFGNIQAFSAAWSPDGAVLAYTTDDGLYLCDSDSSHPRRIIAMSGRLEAVHWSPDGRQLQFWRRVAKEATLWEADRAGKRLRELFPHSGTPYEGAPCFWTPDGNYFIFQSLYSALKGSWALRISSGLLKRAGELTRLGPVGMNVGIATMSPDRSRLYGIGGTRFRSQIERFDSESGAFAPLLPEVRATALDFTKDGKWLAYVDDHNFLWKSRNDGSQKIQLTSPPLEAELPCWSPDGKWVAFMGREPGQPWKVRVLSAEGGAYGPLTSTDASEGAPTWSADGSRLAFGGLVDPADRTLGPLVVRIFDLKRHRLSVVPGSEGLWTARWSPDGNYIAALTEDSTSLMLFDVPAGKWTKLLTLQQISDLRWSRQSKFIYMAATPVGGERALFRADLSGHQLERLPGMASGNLSDPLGLAPDDSPLLTRRLNGGEIYALQCQFP